MTRPVSHSTGVSSAAPRNARQLWVLWRYWMVREFKTRYAGSVLGFAWAFVQPVATLAIFYVLFGLVLAVRVPGLDVNNGYLLHLLAGLAVWLPFTDAIGRGLGLWRRMRTFCASSLCLRRYCPQCPLAAACSFCVLAMRC